MKREKTTYGKLCELLKKNPPVVQHPELLTRSILETIHSLPPLKQKRDIRLKVIGYVSGIAASLLIGLLMWELWFPVTDQGASKAIYPLYKTDLLTSERIIPVAGKENMFFYTLKARYIEKVKREEVWSKYLKNEKL